MSLTVLKKPPAKALLVDDGVIFKINTDNQFADAGQKASLVIAFSGSGTLEGEMLTITAMNTELDFIFAINPDDSGFELTYRGSTALSTYIQTIAAELRAIQLLNTYYDITYSSMGGYLVILTAKEKSPVYNIALTSSSTPEVAQNDYQQGESPVLRENYKIFLQPVLKGETEDTILGTDAVSPDENGDSVLDVKQYMKYLVEIGFTPKELRTFIYKEQVREMPQVYFHYGEHYAGIGGKIFKLFDNEPVVVLPGGLSRIDSKYYAGKGSNYYDFNDNSKRFLTWQPLVKVTSRNAPERLYYYFQQAYTVQMRVKLFYAGGRGATITPRNITQAVAKDSLYEIACDYRSLELFQYDNNPITKYELWLQATQETIDMGVTEVRTFVLDPREYYNERYFFFRNSFGVYDTLRCVGIKEKNSEFSRTLIEEEQDLNSDARTKKDIFINREQTYTTNTGWISKEYKDYLDEFIGSTDVHEQIVRDQTWPCVITSKKIFQHRDDETLYQLEFEYMRAYSDTYFSRQVTELDGIMIDNEIANPDLEDGTMDSWNKESSDEISTLERNTVDAIKGTGDAKLSVTTEGTASTYPRVKVDFSEEKNMLEKKMHIGFDYRVNSGTCKLTAVQFGASGTGSYVNKTLSGEGKYEVEMDCLDPDDAAGTYIQLQFDGRNQFELQIDNMEFYDAGDADPEEELP